MKMENQYKFEGELYLLFNLLRNLWWTRGESNSRLPDANRLLYH